MTPANRHLFAERMDVLRDAEDLCGRRLRVKLRRIGQPPISGDEEVVDGVRRLRDLERFAARFRNRLRRRQP